MQSTSSGHMGSAVSPRGLQRAGSGAVVHGLSCPKALGIFLAQGSNPCPLHCRQILNHWTTREAQGGFLLKVPQNHPPKPRPEACPGVFRRPASAPALSPTHWKTAYPPAGAILGAARWSWDFSGSACGEEPACQCRRHMRCMFDPWVGKIPWRRKWQPTSLFLPGESHGQRSLAGYSPWGHRESDTTEAA